MIENKLLNNGGGHAHQNNRSRSNLRDISSNSCSDSSEMSEKNIYSLLRSRSSSRVKDNNSCDTKPTKTKRNSKKKRNQQLETVQQQLETALAAIERLTNENRILQDEIHGFNVVYEASLNVSKLDQGDDHLTTMDCDIQSANRKRMRHHSPPTEIIQQQQQQTAQQQPETSPLQLQHQQFSANDEIFLRQQQMRQNHQTSSQQTNSSFDKIVNRLRPQSVTPNQAIQTMGSATNVANTPTHSSSSTKPKTTNSTTNPTIGANPPPLVAFELNHKHCTETFPTILGHNNFTINKVSAKCSHIQLDTLSDYHKVMELLKKEEACFHTFTPKEERKTSVILRNLCASFDCEDILRALEELNLNVNIHSVTPFRTEYSQRKGQNLGLWHVLLQPDSDVIALLKTTRLLHQTVRFERRKSSSTSQCYNCQNFGHSSSNCFRKNRCVKCTTDHKPGECPLPILRENSAVPLNPTCVNCGEAHPANFRGCKAFKSFVNRRRPQIRQEHQSPAQASFNNFASENISYAAIANNQKNQKQNTSRQLNCLEFIEAECLDQFGLDFNEIIKKTSVFVPKYILMNPAEKRMALLKFIMSITPNISV